MAKVRANTSELKKWAKELENLADEQLDSFLHESALMLAGEFIKRVMKKTPEGKYPDLIEFTTNPSEPTKKVSFQTKSGKDVSFTARNPPKKVSFERRVDGKEGGHLRKSWKLGELKKVKGGYEVEIYNDASHKGESYASHVEYGHRVMNKKGGAVKDFKDGKFMMTETELEMDSIMPELLEEKFEEFLRQVLGDG